MPRPRAQQSEIEQLFRDNKENFTADRKRRKLKKEKRLFWFLRFAYNLRDDAALAEFLYTAPSQISQIRNDKMPLSHRMILAIYDRTNLSIEDIRSMAKEDMEDVNE